MKKVGTAWVVSDVTTNIHQHTVETKIVAVFQDERAALDLLDELSNDAMHDGWTVRFSTVHALRFWKQYYAGPPTAKLERQIVASKSPLYAFNQNASREKAIEQLAVRR